MNRTISFIKLVFTCGLCLILLGLIFIRREEIVTIINNYILYRNKRVTIEDRNEYYRAYDFEFVKNVNNIEPTNYKDLINVYYSFLNSGLTTFQFQCPYTYETCIDDIQRIANDENILSSINNYVHPYNSFSHIETQYDSLGRVTINVIKNYTVDQIQRINRKLDELYPQLVSPNNSTENNIRSVHDYIINHTRYDSNKNNYNSSSYKSDTAYGPLIEGYAVCGGYTDLMELFLERMGVESYKVSSEKHVWNAVKIGNYWLHLDLTWDDPVASNGMDYLEYTYFLVSTHKLLEMEKTEHNFIVDYYPELKEAN